MSAYDVYLTIYMCVYICVYVYMCVCDVCIESVEEGNKNLSRDSSFEKKVKFCASVYIIFHNGLEQKFCYL